MLDFDNLVSYLVQWIYHFLSFTFVKQYSCNVGVFGVLGKYIAI